MQYQKYNEEVWVQVKSLTVEKTGRRLTRVDRKAGDGAQENGETWNTRVGERRDDGCTSKILRFV